MGKLTVSIVLFMGFHLFSRFSTFSYVENEIRFKGKLGDLTKSNVNILSVLLKA